MPINKLAAFFVLIAPPHSYRKRPAENAPESHDIAFFTENSVF